MQIHEIKNAPPISQQSLDLFGELSKIPLVPNANKTPLNELKIELFLAQTNEEIDKYFATQKLIFSTCLLAASITYLTIGALNNMPLLAIPGTVCFGIYLFLSITDMQSMELDYHLGYAIAAVLLGGPILALFEGFERVNRATRKLEKHEENSQKIEEFIQQCRQSGLESTLQAKIRNNKLVMETMNLPNTNYNDLEKLEAKKLHIKLETAQNELNNIVSKINQNE